MSFEIKHFHIVFYSKHRRLVCVQKYCSNLIHMKAACISPLFVCCKGDKWMCCTASNLWLHGSNYSSFKFATWKFKGDLWWFSLYTFTCLLMVSNNFRLKCITVSIFNVHNSNDSWSVPFIHPFCSLLTGCDFGFL